MKKSRSKGAPSSPFFGGGVRRNYCQGNGRYFLRRRRINDLATVLYCTPLDSLFNGPLCSLEGGEEQQCTTTVRRCQGGFGARGQRPFDAPDFLHFCVWEKIFFLSKNERVSKKTTLDFPGNRHNMPLPRLAFISNFEGLNARKVRLILTLSKLPNFFSLAVCFFFATVCGLRNSRHFFTGGDTSISLFLLLHPLPDTDAEEEEEGEEEESGAVGTRSSANELQRLEEEDEAVGEKREKKGQ